MAESMSDGATRMQRKSLYTNVTQVFLDVDNPYSGVNMDTWYFTEWADPNHSATLGKAALGDGPLTPAQGVVAFICRQILAFRDAFSGLFHPTSVSVGYKPRLNGVRLLPHNFPVPETEEDIQAIQTILEQSSYEGITNLNIGFAMRATVRDEQGQLSQVWLPYGGSANYNTRYTEGYISNLPRSVAVTYILTPSAQVGIAPWTVELACNFTSLFRATNAEVLERVRDRWKQWIEANPTGAAPRDENDEKQGDHEELEDYIVTLAEPPRGTPPVLDNRDLYERNTPLLRAAVGRWEERLGISFEWASTL